MRRPGGFDGREQEKPPASRKAEKRTAEVRGLEVRAPKIRTAEIRATEIRATEIRTAEAAESAPVAPVARIDRLEGVSSEVLLDSVPPVASSSATEPPPRSERGVRRAKFELRRAERERRDRERREKRRFTEHARVRRRRWGIALAAVLGLALFVAAGVFTPIMAVREIQVQGVQAANAEELQGALARFEGVPLALVGDREVHRALEPFPLIQRYAVERIPPHTLVVRIEERTPVIALERDDGFELFDPAGVLLAKATELPSGVPLGSPELSDTSSPAFVAASTVIRDLPEDVRQQLASVRASNAQDVSFVLIGGTEVIWGEAKQTQRKAAVLRSLLASIGSPSRVDVSAPEAPVFE